MTNAQPERPRSLVDVDLAGTEEVEPASAPNPNPYELARSIFADAPFAAAWIDPDLRVVGANDGFGRVAGRPAPDLAGMSLGEAVPSLAGVLAPIVEQVFIDGKSVQRAEVSAPAPTVEDERFWHVSAYAVQPEGHLNTGVVVFLVEVTAEHRSARDLVDRARRLAAVASLGQRALAGRPLAELLDDAVRLVSATLNVEVVQAYELLPSEAGLLLRAGSGVHHDQIGITLVDVGRTSHVGYAVLTRAPVVSDDLQHDARFLGSGFSSELGLRSGVAVVIGSGSGPPWGALTAHTVAHRQLSTDDVHFVELVANVLGVAIQRQRAENDLRDSHTRLDLSMRAGGLVSWQLDMHDLTVSWNGSVVDALGFDPRDLGGTADEFVALIHPEDQAETKRAIIRSITDLVECHVAFRFLVGPAPLWLEVRARPIVDEGGRVTRLVGVVTDVSESRLMDEMKATLLEGEHKARLDAETARRRLGILAEAGGALAGTLDSQAAFEQLAKVVVTQLCDTVVMFSTTDDSIEEVFVAHRDPNTAELFEEVRRLNARREPDARLDESPAMRALLTGKSVLVSAFPDEYLVAQAFDEHHLEVMRELAANSSVAVPLIARGGVVGAMSLLRTGSSMPFDEDDLALVEELGARAALAVENARLFESRSAVARTLQRSLLPPALPEIPGVEVATRYRVAEGDVEIGGDFYDLFEVGGGTWAVVIGDVCGKGSVAAALTGLFRHTVRAVAIRERQPSQVLRFTNDVILDQIEDTRFCTAAFLRMTPTDRGVRIDVSCGGHPLPLLIRQDGSIERVDVAGTLIGVVPDPVLRDRSIDLAPGESIVLYTDGVTEARRGRDLFGEDRLIAALRGGAGLSAPELADRIEEAVEEFQGGAANDDIAIVVLRAVPR